MSRFHGVEDDVGSGDVVIPMGVLVGDTTGNGSVNATDVSQTKLQSGQPVTGSNIRNDINVNGSINATDVSSVKLKSGTALP
jgi:dockerin type I repeat protein